MGKWRENKIGGSFPVSEMCKQVKVFEAGHFIIHSIIIGLLSKRM